MSITTTTTSFRDLSRKTAIETLYILEEQRDKALDRATRAEAERDELRARMEVLADEFHTLAESWYEADRSRGAVAIAYSNGRGESYTMAEDLLRNLLASAQAEPEVDRG